MKLSSDLKEFIELLNSHKVDYLVVGAHALAWHGLPRYTKDIDFFINPDPDNADIMIEVLNAFGFGEVGFTQGDFIKPDQVIQMGSEPHLINLLTGLSEVSWDERRATCYSWSIQLYQKQTCIWKASGLGGCKSFKRNIGSSVDGMTPHSAR